MSWRASGAGAVAGVSVPGSSSVPLASSVSASDERDFEATADHPAEQIPGGSKQQGTATGAAAPAPGRLRLRALTSRRPRTRYPAAAGAKRLLFMRRVPPDRVLDRMVILTGGLRSA